MINLSELLDRAKKKALEKPDNKDGYAPKSTDELRFKRKHVSVTTPDANKNGDDVFKGTNVKAVDRQPHYGYNPGQDEEVYEEKGQTAYKPMPDHPYHDKTDQQLKYIMKDASEAAKAMKDHSPKAESKYLDQVNDAATILAYRKKIQNNSYEPEGQPIDEMQWNYGKPRIPSKNPHSDHDFNKFSDKELKNIIDKHNQSYPENDYDPTGNKPPRKTPLGSDWSSMSDRQKQKELTLNPKIREYLDSAKNFSIANDILSWRGSRVNESAPPGMEKVVRALKTKFGKNSSAPFAIAWSKYNKKKGD